MFAPRQQLVVPLWLVEQAAWVVEQELAKYLLLMSGNTIHPQQRHLRNPSKTKAEQLQKSFLELEQRATNLARLHIRVPSILIRCYMSNSKHKEILD
jgi:hypothetical protein